MKCDPPDTAKTDFANSSRKGEIQENKLLNFKTMALVVGTLRRKKEEPVTEKEVSAS